MTMIKRPALLLAACLLSFFMPPPAWAQASSCAIENIQPIFCENLSKPATYDKSRFSSYKMLVPGKEGWLFRSESDFREDFSLKSGTLTRLKELNDALAKKGTHLVILLTPTRGMMHSSMLTDDLRKRFDYDPAKAWSGYQDMLAALQKAGIDAIGVPKPASTTEVFFYKRDHHWNAVGAKKAADILARHIRQLDAFRGIQPVKFVTSEQGMTDYTGVAKKVFRKICNTTLPPETITRYVTRKADTAESEAALFGDAPQPDIVLLGTSNSTMEPSYANFEGFLKEALGADILNMSVSAGGLDTAMLSYLNSRFYRTRAAKIAIWEVPSYYDFNTQKKFWREAIPAAASDCDNPIKTATDTLNSREIIGLDGLAPARATGSDYFLKLDFEKPVADSFLADIRYTRNRERYKFSKPVQTQSQRHFNVALDEDKTRHYLDKIILDVPMSMRDGKVTVALCKK